jgi:hypothetical protein
LERGGFAVNVTEVLAAEVADRPGGLSEILDVLEKAEINVEYMYAFAVKLGGKAVLVMRFDNPDAAACALAAAGVSVLKQVDLYDRLERG